ncbi:MAG: aldo/keto reductase [Silvanigrellaceae bacterium]|nr:aldo/keto reductase [Silvanigrellaceae bacterium]
MVLLKGCATEQSTKPTKNALGKVFESRRRRLYPGGPYVSPVGFGSYRIGLSQGLGYPECENALQLALKKSLNLIDTSTNYGDGQSEILIGKCLAHSISQGVCTRENIVVVSKAGYLQGSNLELARVKEMHGEPFEDVVKFGADVWYCIHPSFLIDQVERSRARLGLETIDCYLLHNPEYLLKNMEVNSTPLAQAKKIFRDKIIQSFLALEELVQQKKIACYGVSSNTFGAPQEEYTHVSLKEILDIAHEVSPQHSLRVVQMPMNWIEIAAGFYEIEDLGESVISYAQKNSLGVLLNRPFNAMFHDGLIRLTRPQFSQQQINGMKEEMRQGLSNWTQLSIDLEKMAYEQLEDVPGYEDASLSQLVIATLAWFPGVSALLCGMRKESYVHDAQSALNRPALPRAREYIHGIYENLEFHNV